MHSRFKWTNLSERLSYENAIHQQRMRTEISQAKRETDYFKANVERSKRINVNIGDKRSLPLPVAKKSGQIEMPLQDNSSGKRIYEFRQKETDDMIKKRKLTEQGQKNVMETLSPESGLSSSLKGTSSPQKKFKPGKLTKMCDKTEKSDSSKNVVAKRDMSANNSHLNLSSSKNGKNKPFETVTSRSLSSSKSLTEASKVSTKTTNTETKTRSGVSNKKRDSHGSSDRTEFLKNVLQ